MEDTNNVAEPVQGAPDIRRKDGRLLPLAVRERRAKLVTLWDAGASVENIAQIVGVSVDHVRRLLVRAGRRPGIEQMRARQERVLALAREGWSSTRIAKEVGMSNERVRALVLVAGGTFKADIGVARTQHRFDHNRIMGQIVDDVEGMVAHLALVDISALDADSVREWSSRFTGAVRSLRRFSLSLKAARSL